LSYLAEQLATFLGERTQCTAKTAMVAATLCANELREALRKPIPISLYCLTIR
jgi:hypothetical protein